LTRFVYPAILAAILALPARPAESGQLDANRTLFTVMAAINAAGYDADLASPHNHPLRHDIRKALATRNIPVLPQLKAFFAEHRKKNDTLELSQYISFALTAGDPPDFEIRSRTVEIPPDVLPLQGLSPLLAQFYSEAGIEDLWNRSQAAFEQVIARYHEPVSRVVLESNAYLRNPTSGLTGQSFQIYIDLLGAPHQVQTRSYKNDYYVVATPSPEPRTEEIRHAYLFYLLDPLASRHADVLERKRGLSDHAQRALALAEHYKSDFLLLSTASLVKAVESRLDRDPALVQEALREGFILAPYFAEQLPLYEKQEQAMRFYYGDMVKAIDLKREDARLAQVEFVAEPRVRQVKAPPAAQPELSPAARAVEEAEKLYTARELDKAKAAFLQVLQQTDEKPHHARAYYGLARVAALQKDPETAERFFQKALDSSPDPQTAAWAHVYLGRLSDARGRREQAVQHYREALNIEGASEGARRAADLGLQQSFNK
jgi:tetratricopeptide (TPR) repeat protein